MTNLNFTLENFLMLLPLISIHLGLMVFCIIKIVKEGVENLNKTAWVLLVIFINLFGPILFLIIGRKKDEYDQCN